MKNEITIPAGQGKAFKLNKFDTISVINTFGTQVVDCWAFNSFDVNEYMSMETSRVWSQRLNPIIGDTFVTNLRNKILTIVEDTSPGVHDTFMAACDKRRYELLGVKNYHRNCCDNLIEALQEYKIQLDKPILASFNIFMNIEVQEDKKTLHTLPTVTKPGDKITLRAEMDCFVVLSSCPQDIVKIQGQLDNEPKSVEVLISKQDDSFKNVKTLNTWLPEN